ncbi:ankyrin repeat and MYND domain-containing protein 1-like isoform X2 [Actinia tenebrosa]|uniref:Ankyrin repeat and MYND domain-containing protein 1-like isoform X2 n=1 Tax=Actinia tenebrosa TaxID=6105 RepID=A0A6P8HJA7_ACTTE|nr:ankyrin repeat and MYND domain-containing protein 1-like isoform X2 [Actinia tenebrosa]
MMFTGKSYGLVTTRQRTTDHSTCLLKLSSSRFRREYRSGAVYHGELEGYKKTGQGIFKWPNGACYDGEYTDNKRHGKGKQYWPDGAVYQGEFYKDLRHGFGKLTFADGESYEGEFYEDKKHGKGTYIWPDKTTFTGQFQFDRKEGFGCFVFPSGNIFQGIYKKDERDGPGILTYSNGREDVGIWSGAKIIKLCSVMESAFLFQHFTEYNVNAGQNLSIKVRHSNSAMESVRNTPSLIEIDESESNERVRRTIPESFPFMDIVDGIRGDRGPKGPLECNSEELLQAATAGDCIKVNNLLQDGLVHVDVADKTGYTPLLAAAVNCHRDVINCLLDYGANVNKLNDEGLSVLAACHVLFYTKHTWKDNIAENIPEENLFNYIQEDAQKGTFVHRNCRKITPESTDPSKGDVVSNTSEEIPHGMEGDTNTNIPKTNLFLTDPGGELVRLRSQEHEDSDAKGIERILNEGESERTEKQIHILDKNFEERMKLSIKRDKSREDNGLVKDDLLSNTRHLEVEKSGLTASNENSLFSIMSVFSTTKNVSSVTEDARSESSLEQNKQLFLTMQRRPHLEATVRLLLKRGADPNSSSLPMPVLFFATKAADTAAIEILLRKGADTSATLAHQKLGIAPLHIAVALPDPAGIQITELFLKSAADPDIRDSAFGSEDNNGRTPLHIACSREDNDKDACAVVRLLLDYGANPDLLCEGHSPLSLAICSGNDLAVDALLEHRANPSLKLNKGVGSALCAATSFAAERRRTPQGRIRLINKLMRHGANIVAPIVVTSRFPPGTVVDYAYTVFYQDRKIAHTPYHALTPSERDCYNARREMLEHLGDLLRTQVLRKEKELIEKQLVKIAEKQDSVKTPQYGILKSPERTPRPKDTEIQDTGHGVSSSRVTFHFEKESGIAEQEMQELEEEADREIEAIIKNDNSTGNDNQMEELRMLSLSSSPGRDDKCGLRIAVMKSANHMSISALATETQKMRKKVMKNRFRYCYECGRSIGVRLSACTRCKEVFYCSKSCKLKAWNARHREECVRVNR